LNWRIYISILTFTWFITHILEALYITKHMNENCSDLIKRMQI
jgi:hypothetical protein